MDIQALMNTISDAARSTRKDYHLTLGKLNEVIAGLEDKTIPVVLDYDLTLSVGDFDSYRGYYADLSLDPTSTTITADKLLVKAKMAEGYTFTGYKGGDFPMDADTPLWVAHYGSTGRAIIDAYERDGKLVLITKDLD